MPAAPRQARQAPSRQATVLVVGLVLWSLTAEATFWAILGAYGVAWLVVNAVWVWRPRWLRVPLGRAQRWGLGMLILAVPAVTLWRAAPELVAAEGLWGIDVVTTDRARLERTPSLAPPVVFADHPQVFYVHAPAAEGVRVTLGEATPREATSLGHGLFRFAYDPRRDGAPLGGGREGEATALLEVDGEAVGRRVEVVRPLPHPRWLCSAPDRTVAAAPSEETDEVVVVDGEGLVARLDVADGPADCAFLDARRLLVAHRHGGSVWLVDARTGERLDEAHVGGFPGRIAVAPDGSRAVVAVDGARPALVTLPLGDGGLGAADRTPLDAPADWLVFGPDADTLVLSRRRTATLERWERIDGSWGRRRTLPLGRPAVTLTRAAAGAEVVAATTDFRPDGEPHLGNHFVQDQLLTVHVPTWRVTDQRLTARRSPRQADAGDVDRGGSPMGIDTTGRERLVAFAGTNEVWRLDPARPTPSVTALDELPLFAPHGVSYLEGGRFAVTSPSSATVGIFRGNGSLATLVRLGLDDETLLSERPIALKRRLGERVFYESTRSGVSCQSCHLHAHTDGAMHNIGERRLAPTLTVRGVADTAPYLRDGSFPRVRDLEEGLVEPILRGFLRDAPGRGVTLEAYVESLPRTPTAIPPGERDLARERRGVDAFVRARCHTCHAFPAFTNLGQHPLATVFPEAVGELPADAALDTPTLLSVRWTPPYLTDGRADSLREVLRDEGSRHGHLEALDEEGLDDLLYFLETL